jgi:anti-sigma regulatory factor (Ser/Thr protein kinase)
MTSELEFASHPGNLCLVRDFVRQFLKNVEIPELQKDIMILGLDEACTNVIRYAYGHQPDQLMVLICEQHDDRVVFRLRDFGQHANPEKLKGRPLELVQPGGLGVHLIRRAFTQVDYHQMGEGTELVLIKKFGENGAESEPAAARQ